MDTVTLDEAIETVMKLPVEQRDMLLEIIRARQIAARREEMAEAAQESLNAFRSGVLKPQSADKIIRELALSLDADE